jgi:hypothetical protein
MFREAHLSSGGVMYSFDRIAFEGADTLLRQEPEEEEEEDEGDGNDDDDDDDEADNGYSEWCMLKFALRNQVLSVSDRALLIA